MGTPRMETSAETPRAAARDPTEDDV